MFPVALLSLDENELVFFFTLVVFDRLTLGLIFWFIELFISWNSGVSLSFKLIWLLNVIVNYSEVFRFLYLRKSWRWRINFILFVFFGGRIISMRKLIFFNLSVRQWFSWRISNFRIKLDFFFNCIDRPIWNLSLIFIIIRWRRWWTRFLLWLFVFFRFFFFLIFFCFFIFFLFIFFRNLFIRYLVSLFPCL